MTRCIPKPLRICAYTQPSLILLFHLFCIVTEAPLLDLNMSITNGIVSSKIYDKRDDFNFEIVKDLRQLDLPKSLHLRINLRC